MAKKVKDIDISRKLEIPISTLHDWKNSNRSGWRYKLYLKLKKPNRVEFLVSDDVYQA